MDPSREAALERMNHVSDSMEWKLKTILVFFAESKCLYPNCKDWTPEFFGLSGMPRQIREHGEQFTAALAEVIGQAERIRTRILAVVEPHVRAFVESTPDYRDCKRRGLRVSGGDGATVTLPDKETARAVCTAVLLGNLRNALEDDVHTNLDALKGPVGTTLEELAATEPTEKEAAVEDPKFGLDCAMAVTQMIDEAHAFLKTRKPTKKKGGQQTLDRRPQPKVKKATKARPPPGEKAPPKTKTSKAKTTLSKKKTPAKRAKAVSGAPASTEETAPSDEKTA